MVIGDKVKLRYYSSEVEEHCTLTFFGKRYNTHGSLKARGRVSIRGEICKASGKEGIPNRGNWQAHNILNSWKAKERWDL